MYFDCFINVGWWRGKVVEGRSKLESKEQSVRPLLALGTETLPCFQLFVILAKFNTLLYSVLCYKTVTFAIFYILLDSPILCFETWAWHHSDYTPWPVGYSFSCSPINSKLGLYSNIRLNIENLASQFEFECFQQFVCMHSPSMPYAYAYD